MQRLATQPSHSRGRKGGRMQREKRWKERGRKTWERDMWEGRDWERPIARLVVLNFNWHQSKLEGILKHRVLGPPMQSFDADSLGPTLWDHRMSPSTRNLTKKNTGVIQFALRFMLKKLTQQTSFSKSLSFLMCYSILFQNTELLLCMHMIVSLLLIFVLWLNGFRSGKKKAWGSRAHILMGSDR